MASRRESGLLRPLSEWRWCCVCVYAHTLEVAGALLQSRSVKRAFVATKREDALVKKVTLHHVFFFNVTWRDAQRTLSRERSTSSRSKNMSNFGSCLMKSGYISRAFCSLSRNIRPVTLASPLLSMESRFPSLYKQDMLYLLLNIVGHSKEKKKRHTHRFG
jgi:hypothetical protein